MCSLLHARTLARSSARVLCLRTVPNYFSVPSELNTPQTIHRAHHRVSSEFNTPPRPKSLHEAQRAFFFNVPHLQSMHRRKPLIKRSSMSFASGKILKCPGWSACRLASPVPSRMLSAAMVALQSEHHEHLTTAPWNLKARSQGRSTALFIRPWVKSSVQRV